MVIGSVVGVSIADEFLRDGLVQSGAMRPLARLGCMDCSVLAPEAMFTMNRPLATEDGLSANVVPGPWDGVYRQLPPRARSGPDHMAHPPR